MKLVQDFYNKLAKEIRTTYFPNENHGTTNNKNYWKATKVMEDFSNGVLSYNRLIKGLSTYCNETKENITSIVNKYLVD